MVVKDTDIRHWCVFAVQAPSVLLQRAFKEDRHGEYRKYRNVLSYMRLKTIPVRVIADLLGAGAFSIASSAARCLRRDAALER